VQSQMIVLSDGICHAPRGRSRGCQMRSAWWLNGSFESVQSRELLYRRRSVCAGISFHHRPPIVDLHHRFVHIAILRLPQIILFGNYCY
jgi:hypothetical protein